MANKWHLYLLLLLLLLVRGGAAAEPQPNATALLAGLSFSLPAAEEQQAEQADSRASSFSSLNGLLSWALGAPPQHPHSLRR